MKQRKYTYGLLGLLLTILVYLFVQTLSFPKQGISYGYGPALYPRIVIGAAAVCIILVFFETAKKVSADEEISLTRNNFKEPLLQIGMSFLYALLVKTIGFPIMSLIYMYIPLRYYGSKRVKAAIIAAITVAVLYIGFKIVLKVPLPMGTVFKKFF